MDEADTWLGAIPEERLRKPLNASSSGMAEAFKRGYDDDAQQIWQALSRNHRLLPGERARLEGELQAVQHQVSRLELRRADRSQPGQHSAAAIPIDQLWRLG